MKNTRLYFYAILGSSLVISVMVAAMISCGGSTTPTSAKTAQVSTYITDPAVCSSNSSPTGSFSSVYITVTKVTVNVNANAGPNDSGWKTAVDLSKSPMQIDLLSLESKTCLLDELGHTSLPPGKYQQIRLYLLSNNPTSDTPTPSSNSCGSAGWNCVVPKGGSAQELQLSSEAQTGIKIPASQIASGGLTVTQGQGVDLGINFDTCDSLVHQGNGKWRLKPVLHAGEITPNSDTLTGTVVDASTEKPIADAVVSLEQKDTNSGVDTVSLATTTDANGNFSFCNNNLQMGAKYDVVVTAQATVTYNATVTLGVPVGSAMGKILMVPETTTTPSSPAVIRGQVTTTSASSTPTTGAETAAVITISTLQDAGNGNIVTIPPFSGMTTFKTAATPTVNNGITADQSCTVAGTDCENYDLAVPASNPSVGMFTQGQTTAYSTPASNQALYWVQAVATVPAGANAGQADCSPSSFPATLDPGTSTNSGTQIDVVSSPVTQDFKFVSCTAGQ